MQQFGMIYAAQGRPAKAKPGSSACWPRTRNRWTASYQLGLCKFAQKEYPAAAELLETVYAEKPDHDYGMTYLRLAESQQYCGQSGARGRGVSDHAPLLSGPCRGRISLRAAIGLCKGSLA